MSASTKDLVIIHGMFSDALAMRPLKRAFEKRTIYRKIHPKNLSVARHRKIPRIYAEENAAEIARQLDSMVARRSLSETFDVVGHSNGGYVVLFLGSFLERGVIDWTFTVATPKLAPLKSLDIELPSRTRRKVVHFRGGVDAVPSGYKHNPGEGRLVVTFPDEGHSSIHLGADSNGLADFVALINSASTTDAFVDDSGKIHIWPHCREEVPAGNVVSKLPGKLTECVVCDGMHDFKLETLKQNKDSWRAFFLGDPTPRSLATYSVYRLQRFLKIRSVLNKRLADANQQLAFAKLHRKALLSELKEAQETLTRLADKLAGIDKRVEIFFDAAHKRHKERLDKVVHPLVLAEAYAKAAPRIDSASVTELSALLRITTREFERYYQDMKSSRQLYLPE